MQDKESPFEPAYGSWEDFAALGDRSVLDPGDKTGVKNKYIDCVSKTAIHSVVSFSKEMVILDFGCGIGRTAKYFSKFVRRIVGVDITEGMLKVARQKNSAENIEYHLIDGIHIPLPDNSVDLIMTLYTLQYVAPNKDVFDQILQEFRRVLKKAGKICLIEHINKSSQLKVAVKKEDYLYGINKYFKIEKSYPVRLGGISTFAQRFLFDQNFLKGLFSWIAYCEIMAVKRIQDKDLVSYPYVDYLFYGGVEK